MSVDLPKVSDISEARVVAYLGDSITTDDFQDWLIDILKKHNKSVVLVTHDIDEALKISNKLIILNGEPAKIVDEIDINKKTNHNKLKVKIRSLLKRNE